MHAVIHLIFYGIIKMSSKRQSKYRFIQAELQKVGYVSTGSFVQPNDARNENDINQYQNSDFEHPFPYVEQASPVQGDSLSTEQSESENYSIVPISQKQKLLNFLREWSLKYKVNHLQLTQLAKGLSTIFPDINIPKDRY